MDTMRSLFLSSKAVRRLAALCGILILCGIWRHQTTSSQPLQTVTPTKNAVFTSTRYTTSLLLTPNGELWAGTLGGILRRAPNGVWQKFTLQDGLLSHEARQLEWRNDTVVATFPTWKMIWQNGRWRPFEAEKSAQDLSAFPDQTCAAVWQGQRYAASLDTMAVQSGNKWHSLPSPPSEGTHISALLPQSATLLAAVFGDGLWEWDGHSWRRVNLHMPSETREITALAGNSEHLWLGTRRSGIWEYANGRWQSHQLSREPIDHNCQSLSLVGNSLWVSTQEDGMAVRTSKGWGHIRVGTLSSNSPRQMVMFGNALYLRHGNGKVDRFVDNRWERNVCGGLPRREASALAADERRLYVAQWGGWSEFDGQAWTHHLDMPELQGLPITALCPQGDTLWIGTQRRGLAEYFRRSSILCWHDERNRLADDWITTLACVNGNIFAGTFVGGVSQWNGVHWTSPPELKGENVTALEPDASGGLFIATRHDVWHQTENGVLRPLQTASNCLLTEAQALCYVPGGLWIGTRTGLVFCNDATLERTVRK